MQAFELFCFLKFHTGNSTVTDKNSLKLKDLWYQAPFLKPFPECNRENQNKQMTQIILRHYRYFSWAISSVVEQQFIQNQNESKLRAVIGLDYTRENKTLFNFTPIFFSPFNLQSGDALPLPYFKRTLLPWCPLTEPESAVMGPVSHTTFSVSLNKSLEFQSHFHCCRKAYNNNMSVDWSLGGSQGKCMRWGIMISCTYPSGFAPARRFRENLWKWFKAISNQLYFSH